MSAAAECPVWWCDENPCRGEHRPSLTKMQGMLVTEGLSDSARLSVFPVWDELDGRSPEVSVYMDNDTQVYMPAAEARRVAAWLLEAADKLDIGC